MKRFLTLSLVLVLFSCVSPRSEEDRSDTAVAESPGVAEAITVTAAPKSSRGLGGILSRSQAYEAENSESYAAFDDSKFVFTREHPRSTFSIDVDRASYSNIRRFITSGKLPPKDAVRIEEMLNYFRYADQEPEGRHPFSVTTEVAGSPWNRAHRLVRIAIRGRSVPQWESKPHNLVFLIDVSGSMQSPDKLPLVKKAFQMLTDQLGAEDTVAIAVYAGSAGLVLAPTPGSHKDRIMDAIERLEAGGSTAGGEGILLAYKTAREMFDPAANNRVVLATDGDFNVGITSENDLQQLIEEQRDHGIFLTVLGFGTGNYQDSKMELLADKGNGNYGYVDTELEARKVFVEELGGTLTTIAKDVKLQVTFDPAAVTRFRLIGYENRLLADEDFQDDRKDAGELGSGHSVIALYEIQPRKNGELARLSLRYKEPDGSTSKLIETRIIDRGRQFESASEDLRFGAAVAAYGMLLRNSEYRGSATFDDVLAIARASRGADVEGYRGEFLQLVEETRRLESVAVGETR